MKVKADHTVVLIQGGQMEKAIELFEHWEGLLVGERHPDWETGHARFVSIPGLLIQLTENRGQIYDQVDPIDSVHLALDFGGEDGFGELMDWCQKHQLQLESEEQRPGVWIVGIPQILATKLELVNCALTEFQLVHNPPI